MSHCRLYPFFKFSLVTATTLLGLSRLNAQPVQAQIDSVLNFQPPPMTAPGNREAGGQRNDTCVDTTAGTELLALVPETNVSLTTKASPALLAYIPPNSVERAEIRILEEDTQAEVYVGQVTLPESTTDSDYMYEAAIVSISIPSEVVTLQPGKNYIWALMLVCNSNNRAEDIVVDVIIQQVDHTYRSMLPADVNQALDSIDTIASDEQLAIFSSAGLWQDLISELSVLVQENPDAYGTLWTSLLDTQGLLGRPESIDNSSLSDNQDTVIIADIPIFESSLKPLNP